MCAVLVYELNMLLLKSIKGNRFNAYGTDN